MASAGEQLTSNLQELIQIHRITTIQLYQLDSSKLYDESGDWSFGHEFIQVGGYSYNLNRLFKYQINTPVLRLYF